MSQTSSRRSWRTILFRGLGYFVIWMIMVGGGLANVLPGIGAALLAAWASLRLMPPDPGTAHVRPLASLRLFVRFVWGSVVAGVDIARRAFSPSLPLKLGYVVYPVGLPPSAARNLFMSLTSLMPGTLPAGTHDSGGLIYHCLDVDQPVVRQLQQEEDLLVQALGGALGSADAAARDAGTGRSPT
jgi:multicomponent Na+:H+ antiporter subunit E